MARTKGIWTSFDRWGTLRAREARLAWMLTSPTALIVFGLILFPVVFSVWISFHDVTLRNLNDVFHSPFVGWDNYRQVVNAFVYITCRDSHTLIPLGELASHTSSALWA